MNTTESQIKILIVDDEPGNIFYLKRLLGYQGYTTLTAENGKEGLLLLKSEAPHVVILDIMMPEITGLDVLDKMVADPSLKDIPVIMCTAKTDSSDVEQALNRGAVEYIRKPIDETELLARLRSVLRIKMNEDKLKRMLKSKEEFIKTIAHDLRTPFSSISGFAELLKSDLAQSVEHNDEYIESLNYIITSSNFIVDYFNKLLHWAQEEKGEIEIEPSNTNLLKIVNSSIKLFSSKIELKTIELSNEIEEFLEIDVDEVYFSQVINNILGNALKYTPTGGRIKFSTVKKESTVSIIIEDSGVGMDKELIELILSDQETNIVSSPGTDKEKGTGLGLQICKRIIKAHKFNLEISSSLGKGTTFIINIPRDSSF